MLKNISSHWEERVKKWPCSYINKAPINLTFNQYLISFHKQVQMPVLNVILINVWAPVTTKTITSKRCKLIETEHENVGNERISKQITSPLLHILLPFWQLIELGGIHSKYLPEIFWGEIGLNIYIYIKENSKLDLLSTKCYLITYHWLYKLDYAPASKRY